MKIYKLINSDYIYFIYVDTNEKYPSLRIHHKDGYETCTENFVAKIGEWFDIQWIDASLAQALLDDFKLGALPTIACHITTDYIVNTIEPGSQNTVSSDYLLPTFDEIMEMQPLLPAPNKHNGINNTVIEKTNSNFFKAGTSNSNRLGTGRKVSYLGRFSCKISNIICGFELNKDRTVYGSNDFLLTIEIMEDGSIFIPSSCYVSIAEKNAILKCNNLSSLAAIFEGKSNCGLAEILKLEAKKEEDNNIEKALLLSANITNGVELVQYDFSLDEKALTKKEPKFFGELEPYDDSESCELIPFDDAQTLMVEKHKIAHFTFEFKTDESLFILLNIYSDEGHQAELCVTNQNKEDIFGCNNLANLEDISSTIEDGAIILDLIAQYEESKVFSVTLI